MTFFAEPAFFIAIVPIVAVAAFLGVRERPLAGFGFAASVFMLVLLFSRTPQSLAFFVAYLALSLGLYRFVAWLFSSGHKRAVPLYRIALALQIAPLAVYKVGAAVMPGFLGFIGISYITFKSVQVLIETRDDLIKDLKLFEYLSFLMFFPTFTSGPILRSRRYVDGLRTPLARDVYLDMLYRGLGWLVVGAVYKFVGAACAQWLMWFAPNAIGTSTTAAFVATQIVYALAYGLYMFFDFAGYSHMAMGLGLTMGIDVPRNFIAPFRALDIKDFWNRWHVSLSTWLRDFVFMRFSSFAFKRKLFKSRLTVANIGFILNMTLMGVWHGLSWANLVYGVYHGVLLAVCETYQKKSAFHKANRKKPWYKVLTWAVTMVAVFFGLALFSGQVFDPVSV